MRNALDPWLGEARWRQSQGRVTFGYLFLSEDVPAIRLRLKVEINTREHFAVLDFTERPFGEKWAEMDAVLHGDLGAILEWAGNGSENTRTDIPMPEMSVLMVAGARYPLYRKTRFLRQ